MSFEELSDLAALALMGKRLQRERLNQNMSQMELAECAGIGLRTARCLEAGRPTTVETLIRALRALGKMDALAAFLPEPSLSPIQLAKLQGRRRRRATGRRHKNPTRED